LQSLLNPIDYKASSFDSPLFSKILSFTGSAFTQSILAILLIFFQAILINRIAIKNKLDHESTLIPGMLYALLCSILPEFLVLSPALIGITFIIIAFHNAMRLYNVPEPAIYNFNIGFYLALGGAIYSPYFIFIFFGLLAQFTLRSYNFKEVMQQVLGGLSLLVIFAIYHYWNGNFEYKIDQYFLFNINFNSFDNVSNTHLFSIGFAIMLTLISYLNFGYMSNKKILQVQKKINLTYLFLAIGILGMVLFFNDFHFIYALLVPLSLFISFILLKSKNPILPELVHLGLLFILIVLQYKFLIG
jgi:hypothetical protein